MSNDLPIPLSKIMRVLLKDVSKMTQAEIKQFRKVFDSQSSLFLEVQPRPKQKKKYKIKANENFFFTGANFQRQVAIKSHTLFQNDHEVTIDQINDFLLLTRTERRNMEIVAVKLRALHNDMIKELKKSGVRFKKPKKRTVPR